MSITVQQFKSAITPKLHGTTLAKVSNVYDKMREASTNMLSRIAPPETIMRARIENAIYDKVYSYVAPNNIDMDGIIDVRPVAGARTDATNLANTFPRDFDFKKERDEGAVSIEYVNGVKTLRIHTELTPRIGLSALDASSDGTVTLSGDASNASYDTLDFMSTSASLAFDLSGDTGEATIDIALPAGVDLSSMMNLGALFAWMKFPDISRLTSVTMKWGTQTAYWEKTVSAFHDRSFANLGDNAWGLMRFDWISASQTGAPGETEAGAMSRVSITLTYETGDAITGVHLDGITASLGQAWEVEYYGTAIFTDSTGSVRKSIPTADSDIIELDDPALNIFMYEFMMTTQQELKGQHMVSDFSYFRTKLEGSGGSDEERGSVGLYDAYNEKYPNIAQTRQQTYYNF